MKAGHEQANAHMSDGPTLYDRIGGAQGLRDLLRYFYADVRQHAVLGPVFNARIHDWPAHLEKIGDFWARQVGGSSTYGGGFASAHLPLGIDREHFQHWLALWEFNCRRQLGESEAAEMIAVAHRLGDRLQLVLAGRSGLKIQS